MMRRLLLILTGAAASLVAAASLAMAGEELIMVEEHGCFWCARWNTEISGIYPKTPEGQLAPLRRVDKHAPLPKDLSFLRPAMFTPTFILVRDGQELARIEGYPGEDFFWGLLGRMLREHTEFIGAEEAPET